MGQTVAVRSDLWRVIHAERAALVDELAGLDPAQWATPSLCDGWDVHDVVAHLAATATLSRRGFAKEFVLAGFSSGRIVDKQVAAGRRRKPSETLSALRSAIFSMAYLTRDGSSGAKACLAGLRLHATDADIDIGNGQLVEGRAVPLLLAASGRRVALPELSGPGEQTLRERLRPTTPP